MVTGDHFCILNPDVVFTEKVFGGLIRSMKTNNIDVIAPITLDADGKIQDTFRDLPTPIELFSRYFGSISDAMEIGDANPIFPDWIAGVFLLMKSDLYEELSGYDEKFYLYFEDVDFCSRVKLNNKQIGIDRDFSVIHHAHRSSRNELKFLYWHVFSAIKFFSSKTYRETRKLRTS